LFNAGLRTAGKPVDPLVGGAVDDGLMSYTPVADT
jgi:hypothetical protein